MSSTQSAGQVVPELKEELRRPPWRESSAPELEDAEAALKAERVQAMLRAAADWRLVRGGTVLHKQYAFPDHAVALSFSRFAMVLASYTRLPLFVCLTETQVTLTLQNVGKRARREPLADELLKLAGIL
jgi:pterin-4a-carbinolamine dehydratase